MHRAADQVRRASGKRSFIDDDLDAHRAPC
jgi:hypothetical protein